MLTNGSEAKAVERARLTTAEAQEDLPSGKHADSLSARACQVGKKCEEELNGDFIGCWA